MIRNRNKCLVDPPECPMGSDGPFLTDGMIEFACGLVRRMMEAARKHQKIELGILDGEGDIGSKAFGGITYVFPMAKYIGELEDELKKGPIPGIDISDLQGATITSATADRMQFQDGRILVRDGLNWTWLVKTPDPE